MDRADRLRIDGRAIYAGEPHRAKALRAYVQCADERDGLAPSEGWSGSRDI